MEQLKRLDHLNKQKFQMFVLNRILRNKKKWATLFGSAIYLIHGTDLEPMCSIFRFSVAFALSNWGWTMAARTWNTLEHFWNIRRGNAPQGPIQSVDQQDGTEIRARTELEIRNASTFPVLTVPYFFAH